MARIFNKDGPDVDVGFSAIRQPRDGIIRQPRDGIGRQPRDGIERQPRDGIGKTPRDKPLMLPRDGIARSSFSKRRSSPWSEPAVWTGMGVLCPE